MKTFLVFLSLTAVASAQFSDAHIAIANPNSDAPVASWPGATVGQLGLRNYGKLMWWNGERWRGVGFLDPGQFGHPSLMPISDGADWNFIVNGHATLSPTPADNVMRLRNDDQRHYSAIAFNCSMLDGGWEVGALGYGNSESLPVFRKALYFESYGGNSDIRFVMSAPQGVAARFAKHTGDLVGHAVGTGESDGTETWRITRAGVLTAAMVEAPNIAAQAAQIMALQAQLAALTARFDSLLLKLKAAGTEP